MTHYACLTFDFDAVSAWIYREMNTPTPISRGEFGPVGAARILALLDKHDIKTTWFTPGHTIDTYPEICARIHQAGHEVAHHGYLHEPPGQLSREQEEAVLIRGSDCIRRLTGHAPRGYRSPAWDLSPHTIELLLRHGFVYDSSMMAQDHHPYYARVGDKFPKDGPVVFGQTSSLLEMPISWSLDDFPHFEFRSGPNGILQGLQRADDVLANFVDDFRYMTQTEAWGILTYTFHPQVIGRGHRMLMLEKLIVSLRDLGAVFVTMEAAAQAFVVTSMTLSGM